MFLRLVILISTILSLTACNKPDPNPELKDPIYNDLNSRLAATTQALEAEKKTLEGHYQTLKDVVPQTGQIKYAEKRVYESQAKIQKLGQEVRYLELKVASRKQESKKSYAQAFKKGEDWPNPSEFKAYEDQNRLRSVKMSWDANARVKSVSPVPAKGGGHGSEGKSEGKAAEGGGGH